MSWFDAAGLANIAKSALKEAQRTIDKALDIKEEDGSQVASAPIDPNLDDFFNHWGIPQHAEAPAAISGQQNMSPSLWGSFTGSFFEPEKGSRTLDSLDDSMEHQFTRSKLVVQQSDDLRIEEEVESPTSSSSSNIVVLKPSSSESVDILTSPESEMPSSMRDASESVEIIAADLSLASPSSVEVISLDEFASPLVSPMDEEVGEKLSSESVEVIAEEQDEDTMSYTSVSESTVLDSSGVQAITRAPSRGSGYLPLNQEAFTRPTLIDTQPHSSMQEDLSHILTCKTNIIDIPRSDQNETSYESSTMLDVSLDEGSQSDKTIVNTGENTMESSSDTSTTTETSSQSTYLKSMLADAMSEKTMAANEVSPHFMDLNQSMIEAPNKSSLLLENITISQLEIPPREDSPHSSDLVKIGSDHTSGHTSGDELETTTSSDIEIISSPNGCDSSSTQSRQSPAKQIYKKDDCASVDHLLHKMAIKKAKGHTRELSEASSISDDSHSDVDRLLRRVAEMTDILESRESKLIDINRRYAELQDANKHLQNQLDAVLSKQLESGDLSQVTEEYTQRMSALEKKFQQAIREKDVLRKQLDQSKVEAAMRMTKGDLDQLLAEKDEVINELRLEGEKLSKTQLQHSNIIKKLRVKEKENEASIKHLKETVESLSGENERLKKSLAAKDEVERTQIEAVHQLTAQVRRVESDYVRLQGHFEDKVQKYETTKRSLDAAKKELADKSRASSELLVREQLLESLANEKRMTESQNEEIISQVEDLRLKLQECEVTFNRKELQLKQENSEVRVRLEEAEARNEALAQSVLEVSKPLVRQLESLQATHQLKMATYEKNEVSLTGKIGELKVKLQSVGSSERNAKQECVVMRAKMAELEGELSGLRKQDELKRLEIERMRAENDVKLQELNGEIARLKDCVQAEGEKLRLVEEKCEERLRSVTPPEVTTRSASPTLSLGKVSVAESTTSSFWSPDDGFDVQAHAPRYTNVFEMQLLQSNLKQRDGEVQQLQWELNRREQERALLNMEIAALLTKVDALEVKCGDFEVIQGQFEEMQGKYDTLCQLYGEKVEENEELKLDLVDVKEMLKSQVDELLRQHKDNDS